MHIYKIKSAWATKFECTRFNVILFKKNYDLKQYKTSIQNTSIHLYTKLQHY